MRAGPTFLWLSQTLWSLLHGILYCPTHWSSSPKSWTSCLGPTNFPTTRLLQIKAFLVTETLGFNKRDMKSHWKSPELWEQLLMLTTFASQLLQLIVAPAAAEESSLLGEFNSLQKLMTLASLFAGFSLLPSTLILSSAIKLHSVFVTVILSVMVAFQLSETTNVGLYPPHTFIYTLCQRTAETMLPHQIA